MLMLTALISIVALSIILILGIISLKQNSVFGHAHSGKVIAGLR